MIFFSGENLAWTFFGGVKKVRLVNNILISSPFCNGGSGGFHYGGRAERRSIILVLECTFLLGSFFFFWGAFGFFFFSACGATFFLFTLTLFEVKNELKSTQF